jgi:hypothetical protein
MEVARTETHASIAADLGLTEAQVRGVAEFVASNPVEMEAEHAGAWSTETIVAARPVKLRFWAQYNSIIDDVTGREITIVTGKCRRVALMAYLASLPTSTTFQAYRVAAANWKLLNPRGKRTSFVNPA